MTNVRAPLLSLDASGTIADTLSFQKRGQSSVARSKPTPTDRKSLPQMYQRWDYQDGIFWWRSLSDAQRFTYQSAGSRYHMTGFAYAMRVYLLTLPDLVARWRMDELVAGEALDSSKNSFHATNFGSSPITGIIDQALDFILNDYLLATDDPLLAPNVFTLLSFAKGSFSPLSTRTFIARGTGGSVLDYHYWLYSYEGKLSFYIGNSVAWNGINSAGSLLDDVPYHLAARLSLTDLQCFIDGLPVAPSGARTIDPDITAITSIGAADEGALYRADCLIDQMEVYNRPLSDEQILVHAMRRYPL